MEHTNPTDIKTTEPGDDCEHDRAENGVQLGLTDEAGRTATALYADQEE